MRLQINYNHPIYGERKVRLSLTPSKFLYPESQRMWRCLSNKKLDDDGRICMYVCNLPTFQGVLHLSLDFECDEVVEVYGSLIYHVHDECSAAFERHVSNSELQLSVTRLK